MDGGFVGAALGGGTWKSMVAEPSFELNPLMNPVVTAIGEIKLEPPPPPPPQVLPPP